MMSEAQEQCKLIKWADKWLQNLSRCGYAVKVCYGSTSAKQTIEKYLQLGD